MKRQPFPKKEIAMLHKHHFIQIDSSQALEIHCEELLEKQSKYLLKEAICNFFYSKSKHHHQCHVEINVQNGNGYFKASAEAENLYLAADIAADKLCKQFKKMKEKLQHHKDYFKSREGQLEQLNDRMEYDPVILPHKKSG